jgi:ABC-type antimicrobial peptide transport system permease subunit
VEQLLFSGQAADPAVYALVALVLLAVGAIASAAPAWRATTVSPTAVLKEE